MFGGKADGTKIILTAAVFGFAAKLVQAYIEHISAKLYAVTPVKSKSYDAPKKEETEDEISEANIETSRINIAFELSSDPIACFTTSGQLLLQNPAAHYWFRESADARERISTSNVLRSIFRSGKDYEAMMKRCVQEKRVYEATLQMPGDSDLPPVYHHVKAVFVADPVDAGEDMLIVSQIDSVEVTRLQAEMRLAMEAISTTVVDGM